MDADQLLMVASDRVSAFDVVLGEPVPDKGAVLTQISAFWFESPARRPPHYVTAPTPTQIIKAVPALGGHHNALMGRAMLCAGTEPVLFECVVRGYITGSAWAEYKEKGTLAGEPLPAGLLESGRLDPPIFSPATKAEDGPRQQRHLWPRSRGAGADTGQPPKLRSLLQAVPGRRAIIAARGIIIADTKFEFGLDAAGTLRLIDEVLTPGLFALLAGRPLRPGGPQPSFDKQPLRDYLAGAQDGGGWNGEPPPPPLPADVVRSTSDRYRDIFRRLTGRPWLPSPLMRGARRLAGSSRSASVSPVLLLACWSWRPWVVDACSGLLPILGGRRVLPGPGARRAARRRPGHRAGRRQGRYRHPVTEEPAFFMGAKPRISIFMNVFNVHVNRYPVTARSSLPALQPG